MRTSGIAVAWEQLPVYGARLIAAGRRALPTGEVAVLATRPQVPLEGVEDELGQPVHWLTRGERRTWGELGLSVPEVFIHTGWAYPHFNVLADQVRAAGGKVVSMVDSRWTGNPRHILGALYFRLAMKNRFAAMWVVGSSGRRLAGMLGVPPERTISGMYGADPAIFKPGLLLAKRPKRLVFVGQYVLRKGVDVLARAWENVGRRRPGWTLDCYGNGPESRRLENLAGCSVHPFGQPREIAAVLQSARFLILPSRDDHWGLVVHEAALAGCGLLVSDAVGAAEDLVTATNGKTFKAGSVNALANALDWAMEKEDAGLNQIGLASTALAKQFGPDVWSREFAALVSRLTQTSGGGQ